MAKRRMFSLDIIDTDIFMEMPQTSRLLYYELCMRADDDGFVSSPKKIQKMVGCSEDDFKVLISKQFIIPFETGIVVIKHWKIHNYIAKDRYKETIYTDEKKQLYQEKNGMYTRCIQDVYKMDTQVRLGKDSIDKDSIVDVEQNETFENSEDNFQSVIDFYNNNIGQLTPYGLTLLQSYKDELNEDLIIYSMQKAVEANKRNMQYIKAILNNWVKADIKTLVQAKDEEIAFKQGKAPKEETLEEKTERLKREWGIQDED